MSAFEYSKWQEYICQRSGLYLADNRRPFLRRRLLERMRTCGIESFGDYYRYVTHDSKGEAEWSELLELVINKETGFFRHLPSFEALRKHMLPQIMSTKEDRGVDTLAFWSAGCSTGQEAYSLAMLLVEAGIVDPESGGSVRSKRLNALEEGEKRDSDDERTPPALTAPVHWKIQICGSDISQRNLDRARLGRYKPHEVRNMPELYRKHYLARNEDVQGDYYKVTDQVRKLVQFGYLNLNDPGSYWISMQDVIFCQNVLVYFKPESRSDVVRQLCRRLTLGGYLVLAPAEVVGLKLPGVQPVRFKDSLIYQRVR